MGSIPESSLCQRRNRLFVQTHGDPNHRLSNEPFLSHLRGGPTIGTSNAQLGCLFTITDPHSSTINSCPSNKNPSKPQTLAQTRFSPGLPESDVFSVRKRWIVPSWGAHAFSPWPRTITPPNPRQSDNGEPLRFADVRTRRGIPRFKCGLIKATRPRREGLISAICHPIGLYLLRTSSGLARFDWR